LGALVFLALACIFAWLGEIKFVASLSSLGVTLVFIAINAAVIVLRYAQPNLKRPFAVPSLGRLPITAVLGAIASLLLAAQHDWAVYLTFVAAFAAGADQANAQRATDVITVGPGFESPQAARSERGRCRK
jgi:APA family basic amino acid/polyamine antiporter